MEFDANQLLENALRDGIREGIKVKLQASYDNPLNKIIDSALAARSDEFRDLMSEAIKSCMGNDTFRADIKASVRTLLAKTLVQKFGGELEKQVNALKSDPTTRARITIAIEEIVKQKS